MTELSTAAALRVSGASLHYELAGTGPVLLLIHGGVADSAMLKAFARALADRYTVVTYDRRGYGESPLENPNQEQSVGMHAHDAHRLLVEIATEPADVLGLSSGAFIGLDLLTRYGEQVRTLVAFEPPLTELLPDRDWFRANGRDLYETYLRDGAESAMAKFTSMVGGETDPESAGPPSDPTPEMLELMARLGRNAEFFFGHELLQFGAWLPDVAALRKVGGRTVIGGGEASGTQPARRGADALAERLGTEVVEFPGDHGSGIMEQPDAFATVLDRVLRG